MPVHISFIFNHLFSIYLLRLLCEGAITTVFSQLLIGFRDGPRLWSLKKLSNTTRQVLMRYEWAGDDRVIGQVGHWGTHEERSWGGEGVHIGIGS